MQKNNEKNYADFLILKLCLMYTLRFHYNKNKKFACLRSDRLEDRDKRPDNQQKH
jgi:hypothetical protein